MTKIETVTAAKTPFARRYENYIGGQWTAPNAGRYFDNTSPVNGQILCEIARSDASDIEAALDAAHAAKDAWGKTSPAARALVLNRIADRGPRTCWSATARRNSASSDPCHGRRPGAVLSVAKTSLEDKPWPRR